MDNQAQLRPGGLAYLVGLPEFQRVNNGHVVETVKIASAEDMSFAMWMLKPNDMVVWVCKSRTPVTASKDGLHNQVLSTEFLAPQKFLRPIGGVDVTDDVTTDVDLGVPA